MKIEIRRPLDNAVNLRKQHGASLLEGVAYLGIAALVVLGAVSLLTGASASAKANQTMEELVAMRTAVKKLYAGQAYPVSSLVSTLIKAEAVPSTLRKDTTALTITNSWGGAVTVEGTSATSFKIVYNNVPQDVCINALSGLTGWTSVKKEPSGSSKTVFPLTTADATAVCDGTDVNVSFVSS